MGEAVVAYLPHGRPRCAAGGLFIRAAPRGDGGAERGPHRGRRRLRHGRPAAVSGAHRLRHTLASDMLRGGAPLAEIGQVLRHRSQLTTAIYAKADQGALRELARTWPGGAA